ncbi:MAG: WG repeat-containing protein [Chitinophagaceae bacterium]|nr:WG repeat-containing protein [Chitinophagaceae bacterium]
MIPFIYQFVYSFSEGFAAVSLNDKWGFIDKTGMVTVNIKYDGAQRFSDGFAIVVLNGKWCF